MPALAFWRHLRARAAPARAAAAPSAIRCVVLQEGLESPSTDYLLRPWLERLGLPQVIVDVRQAVPPDLPRHGDLVVVSRYLTRDWRRVLAARRASLAGLVYFMDDDLFDPAALHGLSAAYARKLRTLALDHRPWLEANADAFWVATPALAAKYVTLKPVVLPLSPSPTLCRPRPAVRLAYHGTASHQAEIDWLHGVVARVQALCEDTHVEIVGDHAVQRRWRELPRVTVLHPMRWDNYQAWTAMHSVDLGLAPLLPSAFNAARGPVKFFDYARMGAAGLYADLPPYRGFIRDGVDGLLLPPGSVDAWVEAIVALARDPARRARLQAAVRERADRGG